MNILKAKYAIYDDNKKYIRPFFFKYLDQYKGYGNNNKVYQLYHTTMDYIELVLNKVSRIKRNEQDLSFSEIFKPLNEIEGQVYYEQVERILLAIQDAKDEINSFWVMYRNRKNTDSENDESFSYKDCVGIVENIKEDCIEYINSLKISHKTLIYLLSLIEKPTHKSYSSLIMSAMFSYKNMDFADLIRNNQEKMFELEECKANADNQTVRLYGFSYKYKENN